MITLFHRTDIDDTRIDELAALPPRLNRFEPPISETGPEFLLYRPVPGKFPIRGATSGNSKICYNKEMRDLVILFVHVIATLARLLGPGGLRSVVAESVLARHQLLILNRSRQRAPHLRASDRLVAGL